MDGKYLMKNESPIKKRPSIQNTVGLIYLIILTIFVIRQVFIVVMTAKCVQEQVIRDHEALAYISNSIIIPVGREYYPDVSKHMDSAM